MAVQRRGKLLGVLYLENNLVTGAFSPESQFMLETLAAQAAISLEISGVYEALQESEESYRMVFENSPVPIWEEDLSAVKAFFDDLRKRGVAELEEYFEQNPAAVRRCAELTRIKDVNQAALVLHCAASKNQLLAGLLSTFVAESLDAFRYGLVCLWNGKTEVVRDATVKTLAGEPRSVTVYLSVCPGYEETLTKILVSLVDITDRKRVEEQIVRLNRDLERRAVALEAANKELEGFLYTVSHDLRAPIRHIDGFAQLLETRSAGVLDEAGRHCLDTILRATKHMGVLIDNLLRFSRLGRHALSRADVDLGVLVQEVIRELEAQEEGRTIHWHIRGLPTVSGDRTLIRTAVVEVISNAIKFTRPRAVGEVEIGHYAEQEEIVVFFRDNGVGFDMKYANKLFGVFHRLHRGDEFEGIGIGLANARRIIGRHGGRIWAEAEVDKGATFFLALPRQAAEESIGRDG
jgi:signal transduction histidine kinase